MKRYTIAMNVIIVLSVILLSCDPGVEIPKKELEDQYSMIYMPQAEGGPKTYVLDIKEGPDEIILGAAYGGVTTARKDIHVTFTVNPAIVEAYNDEKGTNYEPLPAEAYEFDNTDVIIPQGKHTSSVMRASIETQALSPYDVYMLGVKIESTDAEIPVNEKLRETLIIIDVNYPSFDRTSWVVESLSSEEPKEGVSNGGLVIHTFDNKSNTFWHSKWDGGEAPPPHWFVIDMGETRSMHGFTFLARQGNNNGKPKEVVVELSTDGVNWLPGEALNLQNTSNLQEFFLVDNFNVSARYFKITIVSSYFANYTHLAEINAF